MGQFYSSGRSSSPTRAASFNEQKERGCGIQSTGCELEALNSSTGLSTD